MMLPPDRIGYGGGSGDDEQAATSSSTLPPGADIPPADLPAVLARLSDHDLAELSTALDAAVSDPDLPAEDRTELEFPAVVARVTLRRRRAHQRAEAARAALRRAGVVA